MQIYQPLEPDDFALLDLLKEKPSAQNYRRLCAAYTDNGEEGACLREAWPLFRDGIRFGTDVGTFCARQPDAAEEEACYETAAAIVGRTSLGKSDTAVAACQHFPKTRQKLCFIALAQSALEEDRTNADGAIDLCRAADDAVAKECLATLAHRASFIFASGSAEKTQFCATLLEESDVRCE